jgi:DNA-binding IclR family transcriptional regulator
MLAQTEVTDGTVGKALTLLDLVESFHAPVRFNEILKESPFPKPSTYRLLQTLVNQEMLSFNNDSGHYSLGSRLIRLAHSSWQNASLAPIATPFLDALSNKTGETIHLAKLDNAQTLYLDKRNAAKPIEMFSNAGKVGPAYCTGVGKAMLAHLDDKLRDKYIAQQSFYAYTPKTFTDQDSFIDELEQIKTQGVSFDKEEHEPGIICIAVPILGPHNELYGAISITSSTERTTLKKLELYKDDLQKTAQQIGITAGAWMLPKLGG